MRKIIIMTIVIGILASTLTSCSLKFGVESRKESNSSEGSMEQSSKLIPIDGIENIDIDIDAANIVINEVDGNEVNVEFIGKRNLENKTKVEKEGNTIVIKQNYSNSGFKFGISSFEGQKVIIGIPSIYIENLSLEYGAGNVTVKGIKVNDLYIIGGAGNLDIRNIVFTSLDLEQGVGNTDIELKEKSGNIKIEGGAGNLSLKMEEVAGNLTCAGGVGQTKIYIPDQSPVQIKTSSGLGKSDINANTSGENTYKFNLDVGIGSISVN